MARSHTGALFFFLHIFLFLFRIFFCPYLPWKVSPLLWTINTLSRTIISARSFCIFFLLACKWIHTRNKFPTKGRFIYSKKLFRLLSAIMQIPKASPNIWLRFLKKNPQNLKHFVWIIMIYVHGIFGKHYIHTKDSLRPDKDGCALCEPHSLLQSREPRSDMFFFSLHNLEACVLCN